MPPSKSAARMYAGEYQPVFDAVCVAAQQNGMQIVHADPTTGLITLSSGMSLASWGENLSVQVGQAAPGSIQVTIQSGMKFGLVDWGKNQKNLDKLFVGVDWVLSGGAAAQPAQPQPQPQAAAAPVGAWHPDPSGRHHHRWWDGTAWSDQVSDGGVVASDPL